MSWPTLTLRSSGTVGPKKWGEGLASVRDVPKVEDFGPIAMLFSAPHGTRGVKVEGFQDCEIEEGDEGGLQILGWNQVTRRYPERGELEDPDAPYSGELMGQRNGKIKRKDFRTPRGKEFWGQ